MRTVSDRKNWLDFGRCIVNFFNKKRKNKIKTWKPSVLFSGLAVCNIQAASSRVTKQLKQIRNTKHSLRKRHLVFWWLVNLYIPRKYKIGFVFFWISKIQSLFDFSHFTFSHVLHLFKSFLNLLFSWKVKEGKERRICSVNVIFSY